MFGVIRTGSLLPKSSDKTAGNYFGIGLEKLDRCLYDPSKVYDKLQKTGVRLVRIQSGWTRTEKERGVYDFTWLDEIVHSLCRRGMEPWICLCYGNPLYTPAAVDAFGSVSFPPVKTAEERAAWLRYCVAVVRHYGGMVTKYEIWNEPEWLWYRGEDAASYGDFARMTAKAIKEAVPNTYIIAGALTHLDAAWTEKMLATGLYQYADAVSYHRYSAYVENILTDIVPVAEVVHRYGIADIVQGESGCQSAPFGAGALREGAWDEAKQMKILLRRQLIDMKTRVRFSSYFTSVDVREALLDFVGEAYFGILKNRRGSDGTPTGEYDEKPSYHALQSVVAAFDGGYTLYDPDVVFTPGDSPKYYASDEDGADLVTQGFVRKSGASAYAYYKPTPVLTTAFEGTVSLRVAGVTGTPRLIDLADGSVFEFQEGYAQFADGAYRFTNIPVKDYPLLLTFGDFADISYDPAR